MKTKYNLKLNNEYINKEKIRVKKIFTNILT